MKKAKCYINGIGAISPQGVWRQELWEEAIEVQNSLAYSLQPSYKELIPPAMIRRMSKGIKMGIYASQQAIDESQQTQWDAIITGTGLGCLEDSEKFLRNVLDNDEEFLTPTSFIQSTHNTVGAQIALRLACRAYNFTYVNGAVSFESALLDALLQMRYGEAHNVLVGGADEIYGHTFELKKLLQVVKAGEVHETLRASRSPGVNFGEGTAFFALSDERTHTTYAEIVDVDFQNVLKREDLDCFVRDFLDRNEIKIEDISVLVTGRNGDLKYDEYYQRIEQSFQDIPKVIYKNIFGHSDIASAFGLASAAYIVKNQNIPTILQWELAKQSAVKNVLLYNQYLGRDHSLTLIRHVET